VKRVISYIDGFNLYFGLRERGWRKYYWLDLVAMSEALLKPWQQLEHCHYFTAHINHQSRSQSAARQSIWLDALATRERLSTHFGHYLPKPRECRKCNANWQDYEEKMTDVNIASQMLVDAYNDRYDTALLVSGDSDLTTPVRLIRENFSDKRVIVAFPPRRNSAELSRYASGTLKLGEDKLRQNLLPSPVFAANGYPLHRPDEWH
jgi:uncharacterized LabA/DUF88 family protein